MSSDHHGLKLLSEEQFIQLLRSKTVGRVGLSASSLPFVLPVRYVVDDSRILMRTGQGTRMAAATSNAVVAFEVDEFDDNGRGVERPMVGVRPREVVDDAPVGPVAEAVLSSWVGPMPAKCLSIPMEIVTGQRLHPLAASPSVRGPADGINRPRAAWIGETRGHEHPSLPVGRPRDQCVVGVRELLKSAGHRGHGEAGAAEQALDRIPLANTDVCVLDVSLPDGSGVEVCRELVSADPELRCLMLTSFTDDEALLRTVIASPRVHPRRRAQTDIVELGAPGRRRRFAARSGVGRQGEGRRRGAEEDARLKGLAPAPDPRAARRGSDQPPDRRGDVA